MTDRAFERILRGAVDRMPKPSGQMEFEIYDRKQRRRWRKPLAWAAVFALVLLVGRIGYAAYGLEYGAWVTGRSELWTAASGDAKKAGADLSEQYGDYVFSDMTELSVVPHGTSWQDALLRPVYRAYSLWCIRRVPGQRRPPLFPLILAVLPIPTGAHILAMMRPGNIFLKIQMVQTEGRVERRGRWKNPGGSTAAFR